MSASEDPAPPNVNPNSDGGANNVNAPTPRELGAAHPTGQTEYDKALVEEYSANSKQNRRHRNIVLWVFLPSSCILILSVIAIVACVLYSLNLSKFLSAENNFGWRNLIPIDALLFGLVVIFITIFVTLIRFVESGHPKDNRAQITNDATESKPDDNVISNFASLLSSLSSLAKSIKDTIKSAKP